MSEAVQGIALMDKLGSAEILFEHVPATGIAECGSCPGMEEKLWLRVSLLELRLQSIPGIGAEVDNATSAGFCPFTNHNPLVFDMDVTHPES